MEVVWESSFTQSITAVSWTSLVMLSVSLAGIFSFLTVPEAAPTHYFWAFILIAMAPSLVCMVVNQYSKTKDYLLLDDGSVKFRNTPISKSSCKALTREIALEEIREVSLVTRRTGLMIEFNLFSGGGYLVGDFLSPDQIKNFGDSLYGKVQLSTTYLRYIGRHMPEVKDVKDVLVDSAKKVIKKKAKDFFDSKFSK